MTLPSEYQGFYRPDTHISRVSSTQWVLRIVCYIPCTIISHDPSVSPRCNNSNNGSDWGREREVSGVPFNIQYSRHTAKQDRYKVKVGLRIILIPSSLSLPWTMPFYRYIHDALTFTGPVLAPFIIVGNRACLGNRACVGPPALCSFSWIVYPVQTGYNPTSLGISYLITLWFTAGLCLTLKSWLPLLSVHNRYTMGLL